MYIVNRINFNWNTKCLTVCSTYSELDNGKIWISENGTKATYSCDIGFTLSGDAEQTCGDVKIVDGDTLTAPTCGK